MLALTPLQIRFLAHVIAYPGISAWKVMRELGESPKAASDVATALQKKGKIKTGPPGLLYRANGVGLYSIDYQEPEGEYLGVYGVVKNKVTK